MRYIIFLSIICALTLWGWSLDTEAKALSKTNHAAEETSSREIKLTEIQKDKDEIRALVRKMLKWADSKNRIKLLPALNKDGICTGFDLNQLNQNLEKLRKTGFFAKEFIDNYNQIIRVLDKKIKNKELEKWDIHELPTFNFANDASPWCLCQDNLSWDNVDVEIIKISNAKGELKWNWGKLDSNVDPSWKDFAYLFKVVKVDGKWQIAYMQGFDYKKSIK